MRFNFFVRELTLTQVPGIPFLYLSLILELILWDTSSKVIISSALKKTKNEKKFRTKHYFFLYANNVCLYKNSLSVRVFRCCISLKRQEAQSPDCKLKQNISKNQNSLSEDQRQCISIWRFCSCCFFFFFIAFVFV